MLDPFTFTFRLLLAMFVVLGYFFVFLVQILWYVCSNRNDKIGDAIGAFGRGFVDAVAGVFRD